MRRKYLLALVKQETRPGRVEKPHLDSHKAPNAAGTLGALEAHINAGLRQVQVDGKLRRGLIQLPSMGPLLQ